MSTVTIQEAQARLSELIHGLAPGDLVVITENNQPVARVVPTAAIPQRKPRQLGTLRGTVLSMAPGFDAPLDEIVPRVVEMWGGSSRTFSRHAVLVSSPCSRTRDSRALRGRCCAMALYASGGRDRFATYLIHRRRTTRRGAAARASRRTWRRLPDSSRLELRARPGRRTTRTSPPSAAPAGAARYRIASPP